MSRIKLKVLVFGVLSAYVLSCAATEYKGAASEVVQLPKFCWGQYNAKLLPKMYTLVADKRCGPFTNHYCPGLLDYLHAINPIASKTARRQSYQSAITNTKYTLDGLKGYPSCPLRGHVEKFYKKLTSQLFIP
ncbi:MAG: hypothetical protein HYX63_00785 [Gammaproteobacteria bacterium]|nr:hypothetical protein [Gammaproteobacteria bacterium]